MKEPQLSIALTKCFFCGQDDRILLGRRMTTRNTLESARGKVIDMEPCAKCAGYMKQGIILLTIDDAKSEPGWHRPPSEDNHHDHYGTRPSQRRAFVPDPWRTGGFFVLREDAVKRIFTGEPLEFALERRWCFIEHEAAVKVGLFDMQPVEGGAQ